MVIKGIAPILENQMEKNVEMDWKLGSRRGVYGSKQPKLGTFYGL